MRFKIKNELKKADYVRLKEFLSENKSARIELFSGVDLEFILVGPVFVCVEGFAYKIHTELFFKQSIGFEVYDNLDLDNEMSTCLAVNLRDFRLSKTVAEPTDLEKDLNKIFRTMELIVNHVGNRFDILVEQTFTLISELLDRQFDLILKGEEVKKRGEVARPFGIVHAKNWKDAKERAGDDLIPVYMERDKTYLYEDKKVFVLLPRSFVLKLLPIENSVMIPADHFTGEERKILNNFSMKRYIKTRRIAGKVFYCDLNEKTRKLFLKGLKKRQTFQSDF